MKLAVAEGLWESEDPAGLSLFQIGDEAGRNSLFNIRFPWLLSVLAFDTPSGMVYGINELNEMYREKYSNSAWFFERLNYQAFDGNIEDLQRIYDERYGSFFADADFVPQPLWMTYWSFRAMVGAGTLMAVLALIGLWKTYRGSLIGSQRFLKWLPYAIVLPFLANGTGWLLTELGRQPWIVQGLMRTEQGISLNLGVTELLISLIGFTLLYGVLLVAEFYLLWKFGREGNGEAILKGVDSDTPAKDVSLQGAY